MTDPRTPKSPTSATLRSRGPQVGRADLIRLIPLYRSLSGPLDPSKPFAAELATLLEILGLEAVRSPVMGDSRLEGAGGKDPGTSGTADADERRPLPPLPPPPPQGPPARWPQQSAATHFWRATSHVVDQPPTASPMALPIPRFEWRSQLRQAPEEPLLLGWNAIVPRLRGLLRAVFTTRDVDLDRAVDTFARASDTGRLPMRHRRRWGPLVQVWVDVSERLTPYSQDYRVILGELLTRLGRSRVEVVSLHKPGELNWFYDTRGRKRLNAPLPPPETHVLVLGDLGSLERNSSESRQRWLEFGRILRGRGCHPLALVPCALARVPLALRQRFHVETLAARRVPGRTTSGSLRDQLFTLLSFAIRIEPGLLRAVRRLLPDASDPGLEADVWQHPAIDRPLPQGIASCGPNVVAAWIERFEQQPESLRRQVLQQFKRWRWSDGQKGLGPEIFFEEFARLSPQTQALSDARDIEDMCSAFECLAQRVRSVPREDRDSDRMVRYLRSQVDRLTPAAECNPAISRSLSQIRQQLEGKDEQPPLPAEGFVVQIRQVGGEFVIRAVAAQAPLVAASGGSWLANLRGLAATVFWACAPLDASDAPWQPVYLAQDQDFALPMPSIGEMLSFRTDCERVQLELQSHPGSSCVHATGRDAFGLWEETLIPAKKGESVRVRWRWIRPGTFWQGSPRDEPGCWPDEGPRHLVTLTRGFWMADTPCTQALWRAVMEANPSRFKHDDHPVENVSWDRVQEFLKKLNGQFPNLNAALPTEAQWEYACRAGSQTAVYPTAAGDGAIEIVGLHKAPALDPIAWYGGNAVAPAGIRNPTDSSDWKEKQIQHTKASTQPVKRKLPNAWGLYDMLGNVYEWCHDEWNLYGSEHLTDPGEGQGGGSGGGPRVFRGGSWFSGARRVRCAYRRHYSADIEGDSLSFRLVRVQEKDREPGQEPSGT